MGQLNYTTVKINDLLEKIESFPESVSDGKTPVFVIGTVSTLDPGMSATASVTQDGVDDQGNPKYKLNLGIPKGLDGAGGGGGGVADSVQWANVLNKPTWLNRSTKPTYTASEVGALPATTIIPSKVSQLTNDSGYTTSTSFKTINGESIVGSGNIVIESSGGGGTPSGEGGNVKVTNASSLRMANYYAFKPSKDGSVEGTFSTIPIASASNAGLMSSYNYEKLGNIKPLAAFSIALASLTNNSTSEEILQAFEVTSSQPEGLLYLMLLYSNVEAIEYDDGYPQAFIGNFPAVMRCTYDSEAFSGTMELTYVAAGGKLRTITIFGKRGGTSPDFTYTYSCAVTESGDDTYYLPANVINITSSDSGDYINGIFGDIFDDLVKAIQDKKKIYIYGHISTILSQLYPVNAFQVLRNQIVISYLKTDNVDKLRIIYIFISKTTSSDSYCNEISPSGYSLPASLYTLTSSSDTDTISTAVGGESGLKAIIQALKDGNRLKGKYVIPDSNPSQIVELTVTSSTYVEGDNGDLLLFLGSEAFVVIGFIRIGISIYYTKSSNTFACGVITD